MSKSEGQGMYVTWSGQFEYLERAVDKLMIVVPLTLLIIFVLLYFSLKRGAETMIVMLSVPFSLVGGVWYLWALDYNMSVAVAVGFIALAGVAAETGVVMIVYIENAWRDTVERCRAEGRAPTLADVNAAVVHGAVERVPPKMMTVVTTIAALAPIMWSTGTGSEVMRRIAAPMVGGMVSEQARAAVVHAFDLKYKEKTLAPFVPLAVYAIPEVSSVGLTEDDCKAKNIDYLIGRSYSEENARGQIIGDMSGMIKLIFSPVDKKLLGAHIIGEQASELIHVAAHVMLADGTIDTFIRAVYNYPTLSDLYKYAAYDGLGNLEKWKAEKGS